MQRNRAGPSVSRSLTRLRIRAPEFVPMTGTSVLASSRCSLQPTPPLVQTWWKSRVSPSLERHGLEMCRKFCLFRNTSSKASVHLYLSDSCQDAASSPRSACRPFAVCLRWKSWRPPVGVHFWDRHRKLPECARSAPYAYCGVARRRHRTTRVVLR